MRKHLHPFPARMAPDLAVSALEPLADGAKVLDPMCGSGTVLHEAAARGFVTLGFDVDPLSVLLAHVATSNLLGGTVRMAASRLVEQADGDEAVVPPWIAQDDETLAFAKFWFAEEQASYLGALANQLAEQTGPSYDALRVALSRINCHQGQRCVTCTRRLS